jgi:hypothetical protein
MKFAYLILRIALLCALLPISVFASTAVESSADKIQTPSQFLGFEVGADRKLADYHQIVSYFKYLTSKSPRIQVDLDKRESAEQSQVSGDRAQAG